MAPVAVHAPLAGSYSSLLLEGKPKGSSPPRDQHLAVGQQGRGMEVRAEAMAPVAVHTPLAGSYSSLLERSAPAADPPADQHLAVGQQGRGVQVARRSHGPPSPSTPRWPGRTARCSKERCRCCRIPPLTSTLPLGSKVAVWVAACEVMAPVAVHDPGGRVVQLAARKIGAAANPSLQVPPLTSTLPLGSKVAV